MKAAWLALLACSGCAYSVPEAALPGALPAFGSVDREASQVVVVDGVRSDLDPDEAAEVRDEIADVLDASVRASQAPPARFRARVTKLRSTFDAGKGEEKAALMLAILSGTVLLCMPLGCTIESEEVHIDLTIEVGGERYSGEGRSEQWGSIYVGSRERALSRAIQIALQSAERSFLSDQKKDADT
jgi:hypothetical protein